MANYIRVVTTSVVSMVISEPNTKYLEYKKKKKNERKDDTALKRNKENDTQKIMENMVTVEIWCIGERTAENSLTALTIRLNSHVMNKMMTFSYLHCLKLKLCWRL